LARGGPEGAVAIKEAANTSAALLKSAVNGSAGASDKLGTIMAAMGNSRQLAMSYIENLGPRLKSVLGDGATSFIELGKKVGSALAYYKWTIGIFLLLGLAVPFALKKAIDYAEAKRRNNNITTSAQSDCDYYCLPIGFDQYLGKTVTADNLSNPKDVESLSECFKDDNTCYPTKERLQKKLGSSIKNLPNYYCTPADLDRCDTKCAAACASQYPGSRSGSGSGSSDDDDAWLPDQEPPEKSAVDYTPYIIAGVVLLLLLLVIVFLN
jgi:hypothetical protein